MVHYGGEGLYREAALMEDDDDMFRPAGQGGDGWWDDRYEDVKKAAKRVQKSSTVRNLEKKAVKAGATALRGAVDGVAGSAASALGPEAAPFAAALADKVANAAEKKGVAYLDQKIDASGRGHGGVRYMSPAGGGLRLAGQRTQVGSGLRLAGSGLRLAGSGHSRHAGMHRMPDGSLMRGRGCGTQTGHGLRLAGSGLYVQPGLVEGGGQAYC